MPTLFIETPTLMEMLSYKNITIARISLNLHAGKLRSAYFCLGICSELNAAPSLLHKLRSCLKISTLSIILCCKVFLFLFLKDFPWLFWKSPPSKENSGWKQHISWVATSPTHELLQGLYSVDQIEPSSALTSLVSNLHGVNKGSPKNVGPHVIADQVS